VRTGRAARATFITIDVNGSRGPIRCPVINMDTDLFGHCSNHSPVKALGREGSGRITVFFLRVQGHGSLGKIRTCAGGGKEC